jgi:hypothetical protein
MWATCLAEVWDLLAESCGQIDLMVLLLHENIPDLLRHREFADSIQRHQ